MPGAKRVLSAYQMDSLFHGGGTFGGLHILLDKSSLYSGEPSLKIQRQISGQSMGEGLSIKQKDEMKCNLER